MVQTFFFIAAAVYAISLLIELIQKSRFIPQLNRRSLELEIVGYILFTIGVLIFAYKSYYGIENNWKKSIAWLFFAWSFASANLLTYFLYQNSATGTFVKTWIIAAIAILPYLQKNQFIDYFSNNLNWLNFHRVVFILGYAFYSLGLPLAMNFLWKDVIRPYFIESPRALIEHHLQELDQLHHKMILWALPLLSIGICTKMLLLIDSEQAITIQLLWKVGRQEFLAIATWFTCAIYLHTRIFLRWKYNACALVYLGGLFAIAFAHYSGKFLLQIN